MSNSRANKSRQNDIEKSYLPWLICLSAGLFFFYEFFQLNVFDVINQSLRSSFQIGPIQLSWMSSSFIWANVLFLLPAGVILDHLSARKVILAAMLVCVIGTLGFSLTNSFAAAAFFHSLTGIGNAFCFLSCVVLVTRWFPPRRQALVIGCIVTMAFLGGMAAHTPFAYLNNHFGWRKAVIADAALGMGILFWIYYFVQDKKIESSTPQKQQSWSSRCNLALRNKQTWLGGIYTACLNLPVMVLCALWGGSYLTEVHQLSTISASNIISLIFIGSILGCPFVGWLSDRLGKRKPLMLFGAIAFLLLTLPLISGTHLSQLSLSLLFLTLGFVTSTQIISYPLIAESNCVHSTGIATGIASVIIMSGGGIAQVLFGIIMQEKMGGATIHYPVINFQHAMLIFPVAAFISIIALMLMRETYCAPHKVNNKPLNNPVSDLN
ncbi:MAG: MFS transporter [Legionellaceae bacterium]|nr:MFS transporter [Legionellaceae bacterium]